jgi:hypothetical protein
MSGVSNEGATVAASADGEDEYSLTTIMVNGAFRLGFSSTNPPISRLAH